MHTKKMIAVMSEYKKKKSLRRGMSSYQHSLLVAYNNRISALQRVYQQHCLSMLCGICDFANDEKYSLIFANDFFYQIHGYESKGEAESAGFTGLRSIYPIDQFEQKIQPALAEAIEMDGKPFDLKIEYTKQNRQEVFLLTRCVYDSKADLFRSSVIDISGQEKAEGMNRRFDEASRKMLALNGKKFFYFDIPTLTKTYSDLAPEEFKLPRVLVGPPSRLVEMGLIAENSVQDYLDFYQRIFDGETEGQTKVQMLMGKESQKMNWFEIGFVSIFDDNGKPVTAVVYYEDIEAQYQKEIAFKQMYENINTEISKGAYWIECDLDNDIVEMVKMAPDKMDLSNFKGSYTELQKIYTERYVYTDDRKIFSEVFERKYIQDKYLSGQTNDSLVFRSNQTNQDGCVIWSELRYQLIRDPFTDRIRAFFILDKVDEKRKQIIDMQREINQLKEVNENNRIKMLIHQMQPHFLYNALSSIREIIHANPDYAYDLLYSFSTYLRGNVRALSNDKTISFTEELNNVRAYLEIEKMRFADKLKIIFDIQSDAFDILPLSLQPLVENAVRHGIYQRGKNGGTLKISSTENDKFYVVVVEDDGIGFDTSAVISAEEKNKSVGINNLIRRMNYMMQAKVIIKSVIGKGTVVTISIPKSEKQDKPATNRPPEKMIKGGLF